MRTYTICVCLAVSLVMMSCGRADVVHPSADQGGSDREATSFADAIPLFSGTWNAPAIDADICEVLNGPGTDDDVGQPWYRGVYTYSVATALRRSAYPNFTSQVLFSALTHGLIAQPGTAVVSDPSPIRLPKVAALYFEDVPQGYEPFIEVAIIYQFWWVDTDPEDPDESNWEIGMVRGTFDPATFPQNPDWGDPESIANVDYDDLQPDLAYNPNNGDLYVISVIDNRLGSADVIFTRGERDDEDPHDVDWLEPYLAQAIPGTQLNSFNPRVDFGKFGIKLFHYDEQWMLGFAYTAYNEAFEWHVRLNCFSEWEIEHPQAIYFTQNDVGWDDYQFDEFSAGLPVVDIGPPGSNHAAMVWIQAKSDEWSNCTGIYADVHNSNSQAGYMTYHHLHDDDTWGAPCSALPSVAVHQHVGLGNYRASVSFLYSRDYVTDN